MPFQWLFSWQVGLNVNCVYLLLNLFISQRLNWWRHQKQQSANTRIMGVIPWSTHRLLMKMDQYCQSLWTKASANGVYVHLNSYKSLQRYLKSVIKQLASCTFIGLDDSQGGAISPPGGRGQLSGGELVRIIQCQPPLSLGNTQSVLVYMHTWGTPRCDDLRSGLGIMHLKVVIVYDMWFGNPPYVC